MKKIILTSIVALAIPFTAHATPVQPASCPSAASIGQAGYDAVRNFADPELGHVWGLYKEKANYNTAEQWSSLTTVDGELADEQAAVARAKAVASQVTLEGPYKINNKDAWYCVAYNLDESAPLGKYLVATATPIQPSPLPSLVAEMIRR